jgi:hypothetical protein
MLGDERINDFDGSLLFIAIDQIEQVKRSE